MAELIKEATTWFHFLESYEEGRGVLILKESDQIIWERSFSKNRNLPQSENICRRIKIWKISFKKASGITILK